MEQLEYSKNTLKYKEHACIATANDMHAGDRGCCTRCMCTIDLFSCEQFYLLCFWKYIRLVDADNPRRGKKRVSYQLLRLRTMQWLQETAKPAALYLTCCVT